MHSSRIIQVQREKDDTGVVSWCGGDDDDYIIRLLSSYIVYVGVWRTVVAVQDRYISCKSVDEYIISRRLMRIDFQVADLYRRILCAAYKSSYDDVHQSHTVPAKPLDIYLMKTLVQVSVLI